MKAYFGNGLVRRGWENRNVSQRDRSKRTAKRGGRFRGRRFLIPVATALAVLLSVAALPFGRGLLGQFARHMAARQITIGAISPAQQWLAWSAWFDPGDGRTALIQAVCFRHLKEANRFADALKLAEREGAPAATIQQELKLGMIQAGRLDGAAERQIGAMIGAGVSPREVAAAFVYGLLVREEPEEAQRVLDAWAADSPEEAHVAYMRGFYWQWLNEPDRAEKEFEVALARQPRHELARTALAELIEDQDRLEEAFRQYVELATRFRASETGQVGVARLLRKLGRLSRARAALESLASQPEVSSAVALELAQIELESAHYEEAARRFHQADFDRTKDRDALRAAATTFALEEEVTRADRLFAWADDDYRRVRRIDDLRARLKIDPGDKKVVGELERLSLESRTSRANAGVPQSERAAQDRRPSPATSASDLYALHCSACHGVDGRADGRAARHLFPRPRNLRTDEARLVSTLNGVPSLEDLEAVIKRGMPGTSMPKFDNLTDNQRKILAEEVLRLRREGVRDCFIDAMASEGEEVDEDEVRQVIEICTAPGEPVLVPSIGQADSQAIARGKDAYFKLGCDKCHGNDGAGAWDTPLLDDQGLLALPRDLIHDPFKGGREPKSIYLRIFVGMPGTPHPACCNVPEDELVDLVHYCRSLSREPESLLTNRERANQAVRRRHVTTFGGSAAAP